MASAIHIILPALNEEAALRVLIPDLVQALKPLNRPFTITVVNDGSTDGTAPLLKSYPADAHVEALFHATNQGYGAAIRTGVHWVLKHAPSDAILITMDADNTQPPATLADIVRKLDEGFGVVTASYRCPGGEARRVPFKRRFLSGGANALFRLRFRFPGVETYTNGYRGYRVGDLQRTYERLGDALIRETNFAGGTELFLNTVRAGAKPAEVPFVLSYDRRGNASKIRIWRTIRGYLKLLAS